MMRQTDYGKKEKVMCKFKMGWMGVVFVLAGMLMLGCNSSGSGDTGPASSVTTTPSLEGAFIDSPVAGLTYVTESGTGVTDADGHFYYHEGEVVTFMIGDVVVGQAIGGKIVTPLDLVDDPDNPVDVTHPTVTNMARFLQSLDDDGDPENGITLTPEVQDEISGRLIDFNQSIADFEANPDVTASFDVLNALEMPHTGLMWGLVSTEQAQQHLNETMAEMMGFVTDGDGDRDNAGTFMNGQTPMGGTYDMGEMMDDYMGFDGDEDGDGDNTGTFMNGQTQMGTYDMGDMMDEYMGYDADGDGDSGNSGISMNGQTQMGTYDMGEMMDEYMGYDADGDGDSGNSGDTGSSRTGGYSMGGNMGRHMY